VAKCLRPWPIAPTTKPRIIRKGDVSHLFRNHARNGRSPAGCRSDQEITCSSTGFTIRPISGSNNSSLIVFDCSGMLVGSSPALLNRYGSCASRLILMVCYDLVIAACYCNPDESRIALDRNRWPHPSPNLPAGLLVAAGNREDFHLIFSSIPVEKLWRIYGEGPPARLVLPGDSKSNPP
jgi:hypothetical protein